MMKYLETSIKNYQQHSNDDDDDANQDNESYVSQLVNQQDQDYGSYDNKIKIMRATSVK